MNETEFELWSPLATFPGRLTSRGKMAILVTVAALVAFVIIWTQGSTQREARVALEERLQGDAVIAADPLRRRGILCGSYRVAPSQAGRFVYISHYSAEGDRAGRVHIRGDEGFDDLERRLCSATQRYEVPIGPDKSPQSQVSR